MNRAVGGPFLFAAFGAVSVLLVVLLVMAGIV
jgi:hypothetical protein